MKIHDHYTKFRKKAPQKAGTYTYRSPTMSMWDPQEIWTQPEHFENLTPS